MSCDYQHPRALLLASLCYCVIDCIPGTGGCIAELSDVSRGSEMCCILMCCTKHKAAQSLTGERADVENLSLSVQTERLSKRFFRVWRDPIEGACKPLMTPSRCLASELPQLLCVILHMQAFRLYKRASLAM